MGLPPQFGKAMLDEVLKQATVQEALQTIEDVLTGKKRLVITSAPTQARSVHDPSRSYRHTFHVEDSNEEVPT